MSRTDDERLAREALAAAKRDAKPLKCDRWDRMDGEMVGWVSAARQEQEVERLLREHQLEVVFKGAILAGSTYQTSWSWSWDAWESEPTRVDVPLPQGTSPASAAVTTGRKIFTRQLLQLRVEDDAEAELCNAADRARTRVHQAVEDLLAAWCRRYRRSKDGAIRDFTGLRAPLEVEVTLAHLAPTAVAMLFWKLEMNRSDPAFDVGAAPEGLEPLPESLGGEPV
jgi:hypothetical protein